jgi:chromosome segregation ATPase
MQKQIVLMEHEIKLLKDREVDQKNKASGYETLLRDGIPLNEHFLALKNKFNNERDELDKYVRALEEEIRKEEMNNKNKKHKIEILKREFDEISQRFQGHKDQTQKQIKDMETKLYNERHTKTVLDSERLTVAKKLNDVKGQNAQYAREISRNKMFNKRDEERKEKKDRQEKLASKIKDFNKDIEENDIELDKEKRRLEDKNLLKKQQETVMQLKQENNKVHIDISIAESRIKDLEGLKEMTVNQIRDILTDKRKVDKENGDIEARLQGRGMTEAEQKARQFDAEREQIKKI